jgi:signal transduction histidine kinase/CheY-like chemotaxis protein
MQQEFDNPDPKCTGLDEPQGRGGRALTWSLACLIGLFFAGFLLVLGLHSTFSNLIDDLAEISANEQARSFIGEEIIHCVQIIEKDFHRMATTAGLASQERVGSQIQTMVEHLQHHLNVLRYGGVVNRQLLLNLEGKDRMDRLINYWPEAADSRYVMEIIELAPHLDMLQTKQEQLSRLLRLREELREQGDLQGFVEQERQISLYLKTLPPFFLRINENANRLFFESHQRLEQLKAQLDADRKQYRATEVISIFAVIASVMTVSFLVARQINASNVALRRAWEQMRLARDEAERASQAKSHFVSRMSHELRTPMNAILGFAQLMEREQLLPSHKRYMREINKAGNHLLELINQVLDLAKIEAGHLVLEQMDYDLVQTVDEVASIIAESAHAKGLQLKAFASPDLPTRIKGDPPRVREILINLMGNAAKFTERGEVGVWVEPDEEGRRVRFRIWDTGIGIDGETLPRLFKPFAQADESITRRCGGTGLGLMICKELVEAMGGTIDTRSEPGVGTEFRFDIPLEPSVGAVLRPIPLAGSTALLVMDDELITQMLQRHIESLGAGVLVSHSLSEAHRVLANGRGDIRLIIVGAAFRSILSCIPPKWGVEEPIRLAISQKLMGAADGGECEGADAMLKPPVTYTNLCETFEMARGRRMDAAAGVSGPRHSRTAYKVHVLVVEDNPVNQLVASDMLDALGYKVEIANNGAEALEEIRKRSFDIVLMDVEMPVMDGYSATREIRRWERETGTGPVPVIAMTANAMSDDQARCIESGMDDHLAKPFSLEALAGLIKLWTPQAHHSS